MCNGNARANNLVSREVERAGGPCTRMPAHACQYTERHLLPTHILQHIPCKSVPAEAAMLGRHDQRKQISTDDLI